MNTLAAPASLIVASPASESLPNSSDARILVMAAASSWRVEKASSAAQFLTCQFAMIPASLLLLLMQVSAKNFTDSEAHPMARHRVMSVKHMTWEFARVTQSVSVMLPSFLWFLHSIINKISLARHRSVSVAVRELDRPGSGFRVELHCLSQLTIKQYYSI